MTEFHYISRALVTDSDRVLLVRAKGAKNTFLPGGHVEFGEGAEEALAREIEEELGLESNVTGFCGAIEHMWPQDTKENHEINLVFQASIQGLDKSINPESKEDHLELFWAAISQLKQLNLQPSPLITLIENNLNEKGFWSSTFYKNA